MPGYHLTGKALQEMFNILDDLRRTRDLVTAQQTQNGLFAAFQRLGDSLSLGHRRPDITDKNLLFYTSRPYMVVYRQWGTGLQILHVVHGSRDLRKLL